MGKTIRTAKVVEVVLRNMTMAMKKMRKIGNTPVRILKVKLLRAWVLPLRYAATSNQP
jgi:hypothetical protein